MLDLNQLLTLAMQHKWLGLAALVIGAIARLSKDDARFVPDIPAKFRPLLVAALGIAAALVEHLAAGVPGKQALAEGGLAALTAIVAHVVGIEAIRGGKELPIGPLAKRVNVPLLPVLLLAFLPGCSLFTPKNILSAVDVACVMESFITDDKKVAELCHIAEDMMPTVRELISMREAAQKAGVKYGDATMRDGGK